MQTQKDMSNYGFMQLADGKDISEDLISRHSTHIEESVAPQLRELQEKKEEGARRANRYILF